MNIDEVMNISELKERLDGDYDLLKELIEIFLKDSESLLDKIGEAIAGGDAQKLNKTAHTLKGAVSNFSASSAFKAAYSLEKMGKAGDLSNADEGYKLLQTEIKKVCKAMQSLREKGGF